MLNKELPFLRILLPLCLGIISCLLFRLSILQLTIISTVIITIFSASLLFNKSLLNHIYGYALTLALFITGHLLYRNEKDRLSDLEPEKTVFTGVITAYPEEKPNSFRTVVRLCSKVRGSFEVPLNGSLMIYFRKDKQINPLLPGDFVRIRCTPNPIVNRGNPCEFNYRFYMENHGIKYYCFAGAEDITCHSPPDHRKLKHRALIIRQKIIGMYRDRGITDERLPLVAAITLGQKSMLDQEQKQIFIKAGIMHIMAVSGLHAGIISLFVFNILFFMKRKLSPLRTVITVLFLWFFAFITGLTPSVLRATLMFSFLHSGKLMKRNVNNLNSVLASAFILILIRPSVIFDAGFLLSYSAVTFIICFYRDFYLKFCLKTRIGDKIWQTAAITIVAQAGTLPLTITLFNRFPTWFILTNIVIVPLSSILIIVGCLIPLTYPLRFISQPLASLLNHLTWLTELLTEKAAGLPLSTIENIGMQSIESFFLFLVIFLLMLFFMNRKLIQVRYPLFALLLLTSTGTIKSISDRTSGELIVYNVSGSSQIGIRTGSILNLYSDSDTIYPEVTRHCVTERLKANLIRAVSQAQLIKTGDKSILICSKLTNRVLQEARPDLIILKGKYPWIDKMTEFTDSVKMIIFASDVATGYKHNIDLDSSHPDTIHFVRKSGAFRTKL